MRTTLAWLIAVTACVLTHGTALAAPTTAPARQPPLMRDFIGLNVHTVQFKPDLYAPVCRRLRDYHPVRWDVGGDPATPTVFPFAANKVHWGNLYGSWTKAGYDVDACLMFDDLPAAAWKDKPDAARAYGEAFARAFGPSGKTPVVTAAEVGNEPAKYSEAEYRAIFEGMARGLRAGDPKLLVATCAVMTGKPDQWSKPTSAVAGLEDLYDVLNVHTYPFKEKWPTWRRSFPEDPTIRFVADVRDLLAWRDAHAAGKQVWVTEFGYDASTKPPAKTGDFAKWVGVTDDEQARYGVRAFLVLAAAGVDRAYLYFFNDKDEPKLHAASGITRDFKPKPAFHAVTHLSATLGDYRLSRVVSQTAGGVYCYEFAHATKPDDRVYVAWLATDADAPAKHVIPIGDAAAKRVTAAERMPTAAGDAPKVMWKPAPGGVEADVGGAPVYFRTR